MCLPASSQHHLPHTTHPYPHLPLPLSRACAARLQVSSKTGAGVPTAVAAIRRERRGRDVYVMGAANVGKSAFIRALVK